MTSQSRIGIAIIGLLFCTAAGVVRADDLKIYGDELEKKFSDVDFIATSELAQLLLGSSPPLLIDAREPKEFEVSRLPGAILAEKPLTNWMGSLHLAKDTPLIVYCSVGYRSAVLARELQEDGYSNVLNLKGSIFAWANEGRPLENANGTAHGVHPFDKKWGQYLDQARWQWTP